MRLPGFDAATALYRTSGHYRMGVAGENSPGTFDLRPQTEPFSPAPPSPGPFPPKPDLIVRNCDPCYWSNGVCLQQCVNCVPCPPGKLPNGCGGCTSTTVPCTAKTPTCPSGYVASCGICCPSGQVNCWGRCVDPSTDTNNCGTCGNSCPTGEICQGGQCVCQSSGGPCPTGQVCQDGQCVCLPGSLCNGQCCAAGQTCFKGCCATNTDGLTLTSNSNYLLTNGNCQNLKDLKASLNVTQELVALTPADGGPAPENGGYTMQLNAYNPAGPTTNWMQYVFLINGNAINFQVQYWDTNAACACGHAVCDCTGPVVNLSGTVLSLPSNTIPAGYVLEIDLNNDNVGNITGATFSVTDNHGNTNSQTATLDTQHQFPIVAFEVNLVGPGNGSNAHFSSGAGTINYEISNGQLCVEGGLPEVCSGTGNGTAETSNAIYGPIETPCCASELTQSISVPVIPFVCCPPTRPRCCGGCRPNPDGTGSICDGQCVGGGEQCP
jgi:hypothetical protein